MFPTARTSFLLFLPLFFTFSPHAMAHSSPAKSTAAAKADPSQAGAVIEELSTAVHFSNDGSTKQAVRQRTKILSESALKQYGILTFTFVAGEEFYLDTLQVHKKDGSTVNAGLSNIQETTPEVSREAPMYSDLRQKQVTVPGLSIGDEIIFQYSTKQAPFVPGQFWYQYSFAKDTVVDSESLTIDVPRERKVQIHFDPEHKPAIREDGGHVIYEWHAANQTVDTSDSAKLNTQKQFATGTAPPPSVELSTFESWEQVGSWYYGLQHDRAAVTPAIKAKAQELTRGLNDQQAKIKALYQFVSLNFRYIGLDFGIGRYQPHAADDVLANKYGDCKDKHTLLAALLAASGIPAYPVLISARRQVDTAVPSPGQFDHLITAVPLGKETLFLDTTPEVAPLGVLLPPLRNKKALLVAGESASHFIDTPALPPFRAEETFDFSGKLDESGTMEADVSYFLRGDVGMGLKAAFRQAPPEKYKDLVQYISYSAGFGGDVSKANVGGLEDLDQGLRITYHYHRPNYMDLHDESPKNTLPLATSHLRAWDDDKETSLSLYTSPAQLVYKCKVELPAGITAQAPLPVKLDRPYADYQSQYSTQSNVLTAQRTFDITATEISESHRQDYQAFRRAIESDEGQQMVLHLPAGFLAKSSRSNSDLDELMRQADIEFREKNFADAYADYRKVADKDPKRKGVWTQIGLADFGLRHLAQAIGDFQKATAADPFDATAHAELGAAYLSQRNGDLAVPELKKALDVDPLNHRAHYLLGWYYVQQQKDYPHAVPEFEKALATESDTYNDDAQIRQYLSDGYFKAGQPEKAVEQLKKLVDESPYAPTWNNAAYTLAENSYQLDLAGQYADSALKNIYEHLDQVQPDAIRRADLGLMMLLSLTWDTKGWVDFKAGNLARAEKYVRAAWMLNQSHDIGYHLGQIYEKLGREHDALKFYSLAARPSYRISHESTPDPARDKLVRLLGRERAEKLIEQNVGEPSQMRTVHLGQIAPAGTKAELYLVFAPGPKLVDVQPNEENPRLAEALRKESSRLETGVLFPEDAPEKLLRQGFVTCTTYSKGCDFVFYTVDVSTAGISQNKSID